MAEFADADAFRRSFRNSKYIVVIAGAGLSAPSGIPTFRDGGSMWRSLDSTALVTPEAFEDNSSLVWQFYHYRRSRVLAAQLNVAHEILAKMSAPKFLKKIAPLAKTFHLVTQNIDRLSVGALQVLSERLVSESKSNPDQPARKLISPNSIIEMHGRIFDVKCTKCENCVEDRSDLLCPALGAADDSFKDYHEAGSKDVNIPVEELPRCSVCGSWCCLVWREAIPPREAAEGVGSSHPKPTISTNFC